jgi:hypothetical protein
MLDMFPNNLFVTAFLNNNCIRDKVTTAAINNIKNKVERYTFHPSGTFFWFSPPVFSTFFLWLPPAACSLPGAPFLFGWWLIP